MTSRLEDYKKFIKAATAGKVGVAQGYAASGFRATLNPALTDLTFREFMQELARQREALPDLGKNIRVIDSQEEGDRLVVTYMLIVTFSGVLRSRDGRRSAQPTGATLEIPSQDRVVYDSNGKITELEVVTDMGHTLNQMLS